MRRPRPSRSSLLLDRLTRHPVLSTAAPATAVPAATAASLLARAARSGQVDRFARYGVGAVAWGKRHRVDEELLERRFEWRSRSSSPRRRSASISSRAAPDSSARIAPEPAALPTERTLSTGQSGTSPRTSAYSGSMCAPNAPASRTSSISSKPACSQQQLDPGAQRSLGQLDGAHVVLGDASRSACPGAVGGTGYGLADHIGERPPVGHDPRRALRRAVRSNVPSVRSGRRGTARRSPR